MSRKKQVGVTVIVWLVCLVGAAVAMALKGGSLWTAPLPAGDAVAAAEPEPEAVPPAVAHETTAVPAPAKFVGPPEPSGEEAPSLSAPRREPSSTDQARKDEAANNQKLDADWHAAQKAEQAGHIDDALRIYSELGKRVQNTNHDLSMQCFNKVEWLRGRHLSTGHVGDQPANLPDPPAPQASLAPPVQPCPPAPQSCEPPVACRTYRVMQPGGESLREIARAAFGNGERWQEIYRLNPSFSPEYRIPAGTVLKLPPDGNWQPTLACSARMSADAAPAVQPIPAFPENAPARPAARSKGVPFTGSHSCVLDDHGGLVLPAAVREQLGRASRVLLTPGPDGCLYLCAPAHADAVVEKLGRAVGAARAARLYFARTEKAAVDPAGRLAVPDALAAHAGLRGEAVLLGVGDHFELWDAGRWRDYAARSADSPPARKRPTARTTD